MASSNSSVTAFGGFQPITDVKNNQHVQELGKFAVAEFNKKHHEAAALVFVEVVEAPRQVVAGTNNRLHIEALKAGHVRHYKALVYEKPWVNVKTLTSFEPPPRTELIYDVTALDNKTDLGVGIGPDRADPVR
ncbi:Cysteine proteinase inhibitor 6 [Nymphaea thermarum]|nr:Cysteine proteinase inhibitor 6 [Nymphaea thermarum]